MESPIEFIRSIRDTLPTPVSHFGEQVILSVVSKIENIWRTYVLKIGRHMITVACLSVAVVIFIASRFFRQNRIQPTNTPNPTTPDNTTIPITQPDQNPPIIPTPDIPRLRFEPNPISLPKQTAPSNIQPPHPNVPTIPDPNPPHPPAKTTDRQENALAIIPFSRPTTPTIRVHFRATKASRIPDIFRRSTEEESAIIPVSRAPFNRKISIIVSRGRFEVTFIKYGKSEDDETLHTDQQSQIERVMHEIEKLSSTIFPKGFGLIRLPLTKPPRDFEPYCILSIQDLEDPPQLQILPPENASTPLFLPLPTFDFQSYQHLPPGFTQLNLQNPIAIDNSLTIVPFRPLAIHPEPQDSEQPRATSPTNIEPTQLSKFTQTDLSPREITPTPLKPQDDIKLGHEGIEDSADEALRRLREALEKAHNQINELLEQISKYEADNKELTASLREALEEQSRLETGCNNAWDLADQEGEEKKRIEGEFAALQIKVKVLSEEKTKLLEDHSRRLKEELDSHELTKKELEKSQLLIIKKQEELVGIQRDLTNEKAAHVTTHKKSKTYVQDAERHLQEIFDENGAILAKNAALAEENAELRLFIANTRQENAALAEENDKLRAFIENIHQQNAALAKENAELRSSIRNTGEMKKPNPQLTMSELVEISLEPSKGIKEITEEATQEINKLKDALARANEEIRDLTEQISIDAEEKRKLQGSLEGANQENAHLEADIKKQETMINQLEEAKGITEAENTKLTRQIKLLSDQEEENKQFRIQITHLQAQLAENQSRQQRLEEIQASLTQKEVEIERLRRASTALETTHQALNSEYATYRAESESLLQELQQENRRLYVEKANLHQEMANISMQMANISMQMATTPRRQMPSTPRLYASQPASSADSPPPYGANPSYPPYTPMRSTTDSMHPTLSASAANTSFTGQDDEEDA